MISDRGPRNSVSGTPQNSQPVPGFSLAESVPLSVDTYDGVMRWTGGGERLPAVIRTPLKVRFVLLRARLYSFDWVL